VLLNIMILETFTVICTVYCWSICFNFASWFRFCFIFIAFFVVFVCTSVSQVASFGGWECVVCGVSATSSKICADCDAGQRQIAGALWIVTILRWFFLF